MLTALLDVVGLGWSSHCARCSNNRLLGQTPQTRRCGLYAGAGHTYTFTGSVNTVGNSGGECGKRCREGMKSLQLLGIPCCIKAGKFSSAVVLFHTSLSLE
jgi:hypothetical protein